MFTHPLAVFTGEFDRLRIIKELQKLEDEYSNERTEKETVRDERKTMRKKAERYLFLMGLYRGAMASALWFPKPTNILPSEVFDISDCPIWNGNALVDRLVFEIADTRNYLQSKGIDARRFVQMNLKADPKTDREYEMSLRNHALVERSIEPTLKGLLLMPFLALLLALIALIFFQFKH